MKKLLLAFLLAAPAFAQVQLGGHTYVPSTTDSNAGQTNVVFTADGNCVLTAPSGCTVVDTGGFAVDAPYLGTLNVTSTATLTTTRNITVPLSPGRCYNVFNHVTGGQSLIIGGATGAGVTVTAGNTVVQACSNGTDYIQVGSSGGGVTQILAGTNVTVSPSGGTGAVTINATGGNSGLACNNCIVYGDGSSITRAPHVNGNPSGTQLAGGGLSGNYVSLLANAIGATSYYNDAVDGSGGTTATLLSRYTTGNNTYGVTVPSLQSVIAGRGTSTVYVLVDATEVFNDCNASTPIPTAQSISNLNSYLYQAKTAGAYTIALTSPINGNQRTGYIPACMTQIAAVNQAMRYGAGQTPQSSSTTSITSDMVLEMGSYVPNVGDPVMYDASTSLSIHLSPAGHIAVGQNVRYAFKTGGSQVNYFGNYDATQRSGQGGIVEDTPTGSYPAIQGSSAAIGTQSYRAGLPYPGDGVISVQGAINGGGRLDVTDTEGGGDIPSVDLMAPNMTGQNYFRFGHDIGALNNLNAIFRYVGPASTQNTGWLGLFNQNGMVICSNGGIILGKNPYVPCVSSGSPTNLFQAGNFALDANGGITGTAFTVTDTTTTSQYPFVTRFLAPGLSTGNTMIGLFGVSSNKSDTQQTTFNYAGDGDARNSAWFGLRGDNGLTVCSNGGIVLGNDPTALCGTNPTNLLTAKNFSLDANGGITGTNFTVNDVTTTASYPFVSSFLAPGLATGNTTVHLFGVSSATNNAGQLLFNYNGSGNAQNSLWLGLRGQNGETHCSNGGTIFGSSSTSLCPSGFNYFLSAGAFYIDTNGIPNGPDATSSSPLSQLANLKYVGAAIAANSPVTSVFGRVGAVAAVAGDYQVSQVTGAAPIASPALTGTPTAPTAAAGNNTTQLATTAFVASAIAAIPAPSTHLVTYGSYALTSGAFDVSILSGTTVSSVACSGNDSTGVYALQLYTTITSGAATLHARGNGNDTVTFVCGYN